LRKGQKDLRQWNALPAAHTVRHKHHAVKKGDYYVRIQKA
jgi:hypothetical protein